jgi:hypothetical protein
MPSDCKYIKAARNKLIAIIASIFIIYLIAMPIRYPTNPPNPTEVKSGIKLAAFSVADARTILFSAGSFL